METNEQLQKNKHLQAPWADFCHRKLHWAEYVRVQEAHTGKASDEGHQGEDLVMEVDPAPSLGFAFLGGFDSA